MAKYWSDAVTFKNIQVLEVVNTSDFLDFTKWSNEEVIVLKKPVTSIIPPKLIAQMISHIVFNIPDIPPVDTRLSTLELPVLISTSTVMAFITDM